MDENRKRKKGQPNSSSSMEQMEQSESSRESMRGRGSSSSGERNSGKTGGITNRDLDREMSEQQQVPERGRSQSER